MKLTVPIENFTFYSDVGSNGTHLGYLYVLLKLNNIRIENVKYVPEFSRNSLISLQLKNKQKKATNLAATWHGCKISTFFNYLSAFCWLILEGKTNIKTAKYKFM